MLKSGYSYAIIYVWKQLSDRFIKGLKCTYVLRSIAWAILTILVVMNIYILIASTDNIAKSLSWIPSTSLIPCWCGTLHYDLNLSSHPSHPLSPAKPFNFVYMLVQEFIGMLLLMVGGFVMSHLTDHLFMCICYQIDTITLAYLGLPWLYRHTSYTLAYFGIIYYIISPFSTSLANSTALWIVLFRPFCTQFYVTLTFSFI